MNKIISETRELLKSRSAKQTLLLYASRIGIIIVGAIITTITTRALGPADYGILAFILSILSFTSIFFEFGFFAAGARILALVKTDEEKKSYLGALTIIAALIGVLYLIFIFASSFFIDQLFNTSINGIIRIIAPIAAILPLEFMLSLICKGTNEIKKLSVFLLAPKVIYLILLVLTLLLGNISVTWILFINLVSLFLTCIWLIISLKPAFNSLKDKFKVIFAEAKSYGFHIYFGRVIGVSTYNLDNLFISFFVNTTYVGFYSLAVLITSPLYLLSQALGTSKFKDFAQLKSIPKKILLYNLIWGISGGLLIILLGKFVITTLFSDQYLTAASFLVPLAFAALFQSLYQPYNAFLGARGKGKWLRNIALSQAAVNITFNYFLIKSYGAMGAAIATLISNATVYTMYLIFYRKNLKKLSISQDKSDENTNNIKS